MSNALIGIIEIVYIKNSKHFKLFYLKNGFVSNVILKDLWKNLIYRSNNSTKIRFYKANNIFNKCNKVCLCSKK